MKNYGLALTSVPFLRFVLSAAIGEAPGTVAVVFTGASTKDLVGLLRGDGEGGSGREGWVALCGSVALVLGMAILGRRVQRRVRELEEVQASSYRQVV